MSTTSTTTSTLSTGPGTSRLVQRIQGISRRPAALGETPPGCISLAMGEPFAGTAAAISAAAVDALARGMTRYAPQSGDPNLRAAIAADLSAAYRPVHPDEIVPTHGGSAGLATSILSLVDPGDRVVVPEPTYSLYADLIAMAGGVIDYVPLRPDSSLDLDRLVGALPGARLVVLCSPGNPTGRVLDGGDMVTVVEVARQVNAAVLIDEAYCDIVFPGGTPFFSGLDLPGDENDHVLVCRTFSKTYAMTGWRLGYVVGAPSVATRISLAHRTVNSALNTFVQAAGITALETPRADLARMVNRYVERRDLVVNALADVDGVSFAVPDGAFYAFPRIAGADSDALMARLAAAGVLVRSGTEYGPSGSGHIRISFAAGLDDLREGLDRIVSVLKDRRWIQSRSR